MVTILVPADAEQAFIDELSPHFTIGTSLPQTLPALILRVVSAGGTQRDMVSDTFTVVLEVFATREQAAQQAIAQAVGRLQAAQLRDNKIGGVTCYRLQVAALPQNLPNPAVPTHKRYIITLAPDLRRQSITL